LKHVYFFQQGKADGATEMGEKLGGKGANLAEMANLGIPVPPGFTISADVCEYYYDHDREYPEGLREEVEENLKKLESVTGREFGDPEKPLLVSVRSGAAVSMPGMMDTVLNVGTNHDTIQGLIEESGSPRFGWDSYRRLIQMFGEVVEGIEAAKFESVMEKKKKEKGVEDDVDLSAEDLKEIADRFEEIYEKEMGSEFPQDPREQLWKAINAVFGSWNTPRAKKYREINEITGLLGTAVNVQTMAFGNMGENSGSGVVFTRNPATGENKIYGEYLRNAQGEDVVAGIRTPKSIEELRTDMPEIHEELEKVLKKLERHYANVQDVEFTIQNGDLYILQTRTGKRTAKAEVKIAADMVEEGLISREEAILRVSTDQLDKLLHPRFSSEEKEIIATALNASPGAARGIVVFDADEAEELSEEGKEVILVRKETSPKDVHGLKASQGVLTSRGGMTSHAAIVARDLGKPAVVGAESLDIDYDEEKFTANGNVVKKGDWISIDGSNGEIMLGKVPTIEPELGESAKKILRWADDIRELGVRANVDTADDAKVALENGCEGVGLARTEHQFLEEDQLRRLQKSIITDDEAKRSELLEEMSKKQKKEFKELLKTMDELPVIIRLLDPPLHEFLPSEDKEIKTVAEELEVSEDEIRKTLTEHEEVNPMLGRRGCRLGITMPGIYEMQTEAILTAAAELEEEGYNPKPRIMIPLTSHAKEMQVIKENLESPIEKVENNFEDELDFKIGTMIEIPRACVTADQIADEAEFFSFGTNDLTQMIFGFSRDDQGKFLPEYLEKGILENDPFQTLDTAGVGKLMEMATKKGKEVRPEMSVGICGEHGGDEETVKFCHGTEIDYVSASPYRVSKARLAAAKAVIESE